MNSQRLWWAVQDLQRVKSWAWMGRWGLMPSEELSVVNGSWRKDSHFSPWVCLLLSCSCSSTWLYTHTQANITNKVQWELNKKRNKSRRRTNTEWKEEKGMARVSDTSYTCTELSKNKQKRLKGNKIKKRKSIPICVLSDPVTRACRHLRY